MEQVTANGVDQPAAAHHRVEATLVAKLNLADFQNAIPMLRELGIVNDTDADAKDLELRIESVPAFLKPKVWRIDAVAAGKSYRITDLDITLDGSLLTRLSSGRRTRLPSRAASRIFPCSSASGSATPRVVASRPSFQSTV